jgi:glycosyltransferase involved in cell wall biosynthesis
MESKSVLHIMNSTLPPSEGIGSYVYNLAKAQIVDGYTVTIICKNVVSKKVIVSNSDGIMLLEIPFTRIPIIGIMMMASKIKKVIRNNSYDFVHYNTPLFPFIHKIKTKCSIATIHSTMRVSVNYLEPKTIQTKMKMFMGRHISPIIESSLLNEVSTIIAVSNTTKKELLEYYNLKHENIVVINNCINPDVFNFRNEERNKIICYLGRLDYGKGLFEIIEFVKLMRGQLENANFTIHLVGDGPLKKAIKNTINEYSLSSIINMIEFIPQEQLSHYLNKVAYMICNSKYETGPRTILESMACGTPIIATRVGILLDSNETNHYIPINQPTEIRSSVMTGISIFGTEKYYELQSRSITFVKNYLCPEQKISIKTIYQMSTDENHLHSSD